MSVPVPVLVLLLLLLLLLLLRTTATTAVCPQVRPTTEGKIGAQSCQLGNCLPKSGRGCKITRKLGRLGRGGQVCPYRLGKLGRVSPMLGRGPTTLQSCTTCTTCAPIMHQTNIKITAITKITATLSFPRPYQNCPPQPPPIRRRPPTS